eukprot:9027880-Lingulodinium_polyedra.AAC.1
MRLPLPVPALPKPAIPELQNGSAHLSRAPAGAASARADRVDENDSKMSPMVSARVIQLSRSPTLAPQYLRRFLNVL